MVAEYSPEQLQTLKSILEDVQQLTSRTNTSFVFTEREVCSLRAAFKKSVGSIPTDEWNELSVECDDALKELESLVVSNPNAASGDTDLDLKAGGPIKYAPLKIPARRRTQTFVVSLFLFFTAVPAFLLLSFWLLWNPFTMPFMVAYVIYIFVRPPKHPVKPWKRWTEGWVFKNYRDYFPARCVCHKENRDKFDAKKNYLFCYHPHGVHVFGAIVNFVGRSTETPKLLPGLTFHLQSLALNFYIPFWRDIFMWGGTGDASRTCIKKTLSSGPGQCVVLVVGGAEESMLARPGSNDMVLSKRKGFVKIALQMGSPLVPVFGFGENNVYGNYADGRPWLKNLVKKMKKTLGFAPLLIQGRGYFNYSFGVLPHRRPIVTVIGAPLEMPQISNPTQEDIDKYHKLYVEALMKLYQENKGVYDAIAKTEAKIVS